MNRNKLNNKPSKRNYSNSLRIALFFSFGLIVFGLILQLLLADLNISNFKWPLNCIALLILIVIVFFLGAIKRNNGIVKWLSSGQVAIASIIGFVCVVLLMGFISQEETKSILITKLGLNQITSGWPYLLSLLFLLLSLGTISVKRLLSFKRKDLGFVLNHIGLWITLVSASFGFPDQVNLRTILVENTPKAHAYSQDGKIASLPFELNLLQFELEEYNPKLTIVNTKNSSFEQKSGENTLLIKQGIRSKIGDWEIEVKSFIKHAQLLNNKITPHDSIGSSPAAKVIVYNGKTDKRYEDWVSCGGQLIDRKSIELNDSISLIMLYPEPKELKSTITIYNGQGVVQQATIEINEPTKYKSWNIYQLSFNESDGKWSSESTIGLVKDPWLPIVKTGLFMLVIGAVFIFWQGKS